MLVVVDVDVITTNIPPKEKGWQELDTVSILSESIHCLFF